MGAETMNWILIRWLVSCLVFAIMGVAGNISSIAGVAESSNNTMHGSTGHGHNSASTTGGMASVGGGDTDAQNHGFRMPEASEAGGGQHIHQDSPSMELGVSEKIGQTLPLDIVLIDENQKRHNLGDIITKPTILVLVYYTCPTVCPTIQANLAYTLKRTSRKLGNDYTVISVSFDKADTPRDAGYARRNFTSLLGEQSDVDWQFYTADEANIMRLTNAVGFHFKEMSPRNFVHPNLVTVLSGQGKVIRYLYGEAYLPFDISMALAEAGRNTPGVSIKKIISYCFDYDPKNKRYAFQLFRVIGTATLATLGVVMFLLLRPHRKKVKDAP